MVPNSDAHLGSFFFTASRQGTKKNPKEQKKNEEIKKTTLKNIAI